MPRQLRRILSYYSAVPGDPAAVRTDAQRAGGSAACIAADPVPRLKVQARPASYYSAVPGDPEMDAENHARATDEEDREAIDRTDNKQESEEEMLSGDEQFICDDDEGVTPEEKRAREASGDECAGDADKEYERAIEAASRWRLVTATEFKATRKRKRD
jgi:hypothetical protein